MGCKWCALGEMCVGPNGGIDDMEANCDCDCHCCDECGSAFCESVGGDQVCEYSDDDFGDYDE